MNHKFDPKKFAKLDSPDRKKMLPPEEVISKAGLVEGEVIADIGCGIGYFTIPMARVVGDTGMVYGLDISDEMLNEAEKRIEKAGLNNVTFFKSEENQFPLKDQSVNVAFLSNILHEATDKTSFMQEIYRVLKRDGVLIVVDWKKELMEMGPPLEHRLSIEEVKELISAAKLNYLQDSTVGKGHYLIKAMK